MGETNQYIEYQIRKLQSPKTKDRYEACGTLGNIKDLPPEALKALQNAINDPDSEVGNAAKKALYAVSLSVQNKQNDFTSYVSQSASGINTGSEIRRNVPQYAPKVKTSNNANGFRLFAALIYVGGFFVGLFNSNVNTGYGLMEFSFSLALNYWVAVFICGTVILGVAEIINLLEKIVNE